MTFEANERNLKKRRKAARAKDDPSGPPLPEEAELKEPLRVGASLLVSGKYWPLEEPSIASLWFPCTVTDVEDLGEALTQYVIYCPSDRTEYKLHHNYVGHTDASIAKLLLSDGPVERTKQPAERESRPVSRQSMVDGPRSAVTSVGNGASAHLAAKIDLLLARLPSDNAPNSNPLQPLSVPGSSHVLYTNLFFNAATPS